MFTCNRKKINIINSNKIAREISTFDFNTLYTNLEHQVLISVLLNFVEFSFNGECKDQKVYRKYVTWLELPIFGQKRVYVTAISSSKLK